MPCAATLLAVSALHADSLQHGIGAGAVVLTIESSATRLDLGNGRAAVLDVDASFAGHDLAVAGDGWLVAGSRRGIDRRERLALLTGSGERRRELPAPSGQIARLRTMPVVLGADLLLAGGAGGGLAWLEGSNPSSFAVWAANWTGTAFEESRVVSPAGPGTQTALRGTTLADGSWLLVWTAFDGSDDEVMWSVCSGGEWSEPLRVAGDDAWPDITPTLVASGHGALLAWSRFDGGQYRLALASFEDGEWSVPKWLATGSGLYPELLRGVAEPLLSYLEISEQGARRWVVAELDAGERRVAQRARVRSAAAERPIVVATGRDGVLLRWQGEGTIIPARSASVFRAWEAAAP